MATYSIKTSRTQEAGLQFSYNTYADKTLYPTVESYFQARINAQVTNPMYQDQQRASSIAFDQSFSTIPETQQPAARTEIEGVITAHGGTIVAPGTPPTPVLSGNITGRVIPVTGPTASQAFRGGEGNSESPQTSRPDGDGDNET